MDDAERNILKQRVIDELQHHKGPDNCIKMWEIFTAITGQHIIPIKKTDQTRIIRTLIEQLRKEGHPIGNKPGTYGGYFLATCDEELEGTIKNFHNRAMSSLEQEAALKRTNPSKLMQQCMIDFEEQENSNNGKG